MPRSNEEKKIFETHVLSAARSAGVPIPAGGKRRERPDFSFQGGTLGIEVSELLRPESSNHGIRPVAEETYHNKVVRMGQELYYDGDGAKPAKVVVYFANARGKRRDKGEMAGALCEFVKANVHLANPVANFDRIDLPEGFGSMSIAAESGDWWCGECGGLTLSGIQEVLVSAISKKNKLLPEYRKNLPGAQVWLLLYSRSAVSRDMAIPHGVEKWQFDSDFDRIFWFRYLENRFVEIQRSNAGCRA